MTQSVHFLVVHEQGIDYEIEHCPGCPQIDWLIDPNGEPIKAYNCLIGALVTEAGLESLDFDWRTLSEGRYEIDAWTRKYAAIPGIRPEEWDAGLELRENP